MFASILLAASLFAGFADPPVSVRPWCYWWWINSHADCETMTADLEAMKRLGFGGVLMFDSRGYHDGSEKMFPNPKEDVSWGSPAWYDRVEFAVRECARLGLVFTMNASASGGKLNGFVDGQEYEVDITDRVAVSNHLERVMNPLLRRIPDLVGTTFTHIYSVSYEGSAKKGGTWQDARDGLYATMTAWAHAHGLKVYSESGGPWAGSGRRAFEGANQLELLSFNDEPQGEFWPLREKGTTADSGHANANGNFFLRGIVKSARQGGKRIVSAEAFTHMHRHWSVDPAFLKPLADQAFADGVNRLVWHTFTCSPAKFGVPGAEYFAGSHINRNVTWHAEAAPFVRYLGRCQYLLQQGEPVDDGEFPVEEKTYYGFGRHRADPSAKFTWTHRRTADADIFFVAGEGKGEVALAAVAESVELWDAVTGTRTVAEARPAGTGKTTVSLDLPVGGSMFVVFGRGGEKVERGEKVEGDGRILTGPWNVSFAYHPGVTAEPPAAVVMDRLVDWTTRADLRFFAGTATYKTTFESGTVDRSCRQGRRRYALSLGRVPSGLAHVFVNGKDCGTVWCAPWEADVSDAVRQGVNELVIRYTNNWYNRLVGDCSLPPERRVTRSTIRYWNIPRTGDPANVWAMSPTPFSGFSSFDRLQESGLLGPIEIK